MKLIFSKALNYLYIGVNWFKLALKALLVDKISAILVVTSLLINLLAFIGAWFLNKIIGSDLAVLHYNVLFGIDLVGDANKLFLVPLIGLFILIINILLGTILHSSKDRLISSMLLVTALVVNIFCLIALYFSYVINFS